MDINNQKLIEWVLRIAVAGEFIGHGLLAIGGKKDWVGWISQITSTSNPTAVSLLWWIGAFDLAVALIVLVRPVRVALLWAAFWGFWTALVRPLVGVGWLDFVERAANFGAPIALLLIRGLPKSFREWFQ